jgi:hypothetical protein
MTRGRYLLMIGASLLAAGCAASQELKIRPVGQSAVKPGPGSTLLAEARGQLALGNAGLALEAFRTLQRQSPEGADAYQGIAECYAAMGRYDLARTNYEFALAYAPNDPALLRELAGTLDRLGEHEQAGEVRGEADRMAAAPLPAPAATQQAAAITPMAVPRARSVTVKLAAPVPVVQPKPAIAPAPVSPVRAAVTSIAAARVERPVAPSAAPSRRSEVPLVAVAQVVAAAAPRPATIPAAIASARAPALAPAPARRDAQRPAQPEPVHPQLAVVAPPAREFEQAKEPHLERSTRGEVLLVTVQRPVEVAQSAARPIQHAAARAPGAPPAPVDRPAALAATQVRWVPLKGARPGNIQILNAARLQGLAAHTRNALAVRGWRRMAIGNAREVRQHSLVLYGSTRLHLAKRLAAQFRCRAVKVSGMRSVVVLLGRDAMRRSSPTSRA